jgi:hypothetical protein
MTAMNCRTLAEVCNEVYRECSYGYILIVGSSGDSSVWACTRKISQCIIFVLLFWVGWDWVHLVLRPLLYQLQMIDDGDCGAIGAMKIGRGNRCTRRKPTPVPLCPPKIPHDLTWVRTWAAAVGCQRISLLSRGPRFHKPLCGLYYKLITYISDMIFIKQNKMVKLCS